MLVDILSLSIFTIILRIIPKFFNNKINSDTWGHFVLAESIRRNGFKIPNKVDGYLLPNEFDYPFGFHILLSFIPLEYRIKFERVISAFFDTIFVVIAYLLFTYLFPLFDIEISLAFYCSLLLSLSPTLLKVSSGPRAYDATPRVFAELLIFLYFICMLFFYIDGNYFSYLIAIFIASISLLTSKFSLQVLILFSLIMTIFLNSLSLFIAPIFVFITALILSNGKYMKIFLGQLKHLHLLATKNRDTFTVNRIEDYKQFFVHIMKFDFKNAYRIFNNKLVYLNFIYKDFEILILIVLFYFIGNTIENEYYVYFYSWFVAGFISFLITGNHQFKFIGEADRYLEYSIFPVYMLIIVNLQEDVMYLFVPFFILYIYNVLKYSHGKKYKLSELYNVTSFIKKQYSNNTHKLLGLLENETFYQGEVLTGIDTIAASQWTLESWGEELWNKYYYPEYPIRTNDFEWMYTKFGVNLVLVYEPYITMIKEKYGHEYKFDNFQQVYNKNNFIVYEKVQ